MLSLASWIDSREETKFSRFCLSYQILPLKHLGKGNFLIFSSTREFNLRTLVISIPPSCLLEQRPVEWLFFCTIYDNILSSSRWCTSSLLEQGLTLLHTTLQVKAPPHTALILWLYMYSLKRILPMLLKKLIALQFVPLVAPS